MRDYYLYWLGVLCCTSGMSYIEQPENSVLVGIVIIYSGMAAFVWAGVNMVKRGDE